MKNHFFILLERSEELRKKVAAKLKYTQERKSYYLLRLKNPSDTQGNLLFIELDRIRYTVLQHHISIYEYRDREEQGSLQTTYHYTVNLIDDRSNLTTMHLHFDRRGTVVSNDANLSAENLKKVVGFSKPIVSEVMLDLFNEYEALVQEQEKYLQTVMTEFSTVDFTTLTKKQLHELNVRLESVLPELQKWASYHLGTFNKFVLTSVKSLHTNLATYRASRRVVTEKQSKTIVISAPEQPTSATQEVVQDTRLINLHREWQDIIKLPTNSAAELVIKLNSLHVFFDKANDNNIMQQWICVYAGLRAQAEKMFETAIIVLDITTVQKLVQLTPRVEIKHIRYLIERTQQNQFARAEILRLIFPLAIFDINVLFALNQVPIDTIRNLDTDILHIGSTLLWHAYMHQELAVMEALMQLGADPDFPGNRGHSILMLASRRNELEVVQLFLRFGANPNFATTPVMCDLSLVRIGSEQLPQAINTFTTKQDINSVRNKAKKPNDFTPSAEVKLTTEATRSSYQDGCTALLLACSYLHIAIAKTLLEHGAFAETTYLELNMNPLTALLMSDPNEIEFTSEVRELITMLLERGADIHFKSGRPKQFNLAVHAVMTNRPQTLRFLLEKGVEFDVRIANQNIVGGLVKHSLHLNYILCCKLLLRASAKPNCVFVDTEIEDVFYALIPTEIRTESPRLFSHKADGTTYSCELTDLRQPREAKLFRFSGECILDGSHWLAIVENYLQHGFSALQKNCQSLQFIEITAVNLYTEESEVHQLQSISQFKPV